MKGMGLNRGIDFTHISELCSLDCIILHGSHCPLSMEHQMVRLMMIAKQTVTNHGVTKLQMETKRPILMAANSTSFPLIRNTVWAGAATPRYFTNIGWLLSFMTMSRSEVAGKPYNPTVRCLFQTMVNSFTGKQLEHLKINMHHMC